MKFPVNIDAFISAEELLAEEELPRNSRILCAEFLNAANSVYYDALSGELDCNPFGGDVAADVREYHRQHGFSDACDLDKMTKLISVLCTWATMAYNQGLQDRKAVN